MKFLRLVAAVVPLFSAAIMVADSTGPGVTTPESLYPQLDVILRQAVAQSPRMVARAVDLEIAENDRIAARSGLLPAIGGYYRFYEAKDKRADLGSRLSVQKEYYDFNISQPLFHWGERRNNARIGEIRESMVSGNVREAYRVLAQEIRSLYLQLIIAKVRAQRAEFLNRYAAGQLKTGEARLANKVISDAQIFGLRIDAERAQITDERARFDLENAKISFSRLTGTPVLADDAIPDAIPRATPQLETVRSLLAGYLGQKDIPTAEAVVARKTLEIERLNLANAKTRLRPKVNLVAGVSQDEQSYTINASQKYAVNSYYGGVSASWTLFDGFASGAAKRSSLARVRQLERDYRELTERLAQTAQNQVRLAGFSERYMSISDKFLESGEGNLKAKKEEFSRGVISEEDVSGAQVNLYDSQISAFASRADYYTQLCDFLGTITEDPVLANMPRS